MKPSTRRRVLRGAGLLATLPAAVLANPPRAGNWPQRTVPIVVPHAPGRGADIFVRSTAEAGMAGFGFTGSDGL